jgi:uncharacterized protein
MNLKSRITDDMKSAMRSKDAQRLESIRMIRAAIQRREVDDRSELDDAGVTGVLQKLLKQGRDSLTQFEAGGREDLADKERSFISVIQTYLPEPIDEGELESMIDTAIDETGAKEIRDMGKVMGKLKPLIDGRADMASVSNRIRQRLAG